MDHPFLELLLGDKRKIKRIDLPKPVDTILNYLGDEIPAQLINYSFNGMGLYIPEEYTENNQVLLTETHVQFPNHKFLGQLVHQQRRESGIIQVGFALPQNQQKSKFLFRMNDPDWDVVKDKEQVQNIYNDLVLIPFRYKVEIFQNQSAISFYPTKITDAGTMVGEFCETIQGKVNSGEAFCNFDLFQTYHLFQTKVLRCDEKHVEIGLSSKVQRLLRRETLRVEKEERDYELRVTLKSKLLDQEFIDDQILDYSEHGISIIDYDQKYSFPKDMPIDSISIEIKNGPRVEAVGNIRNYIWNAEKKSYVLGLKIHIEDNKQLTSWHDFILKARYPNLEFKYQGSDHPQIWNLFDRSGYLDLKEKDEFEDVKQWTGVTWEKLAETGSKYSRRIKIVNSDGIVAHLQMDKMYPHTWYLHHLAIDPKSNKTIGKDIYFVSTDVLIGEETSYLLTLTELSKKWNQKNYYDFIDRYPDPQFHDLKKFLMFEVNLPNFENFSVAGNYTVDYASKYELRYIRKYFENNSSDLLYKAYSYGYDIELQDFKKKLGDFNIYRERKFLVLKEKGEIIGFSQLEISSRGINILSYFDLIYCFNIEEIPIEKKVDLYKCLLNSACNHYKSIGKTKITAILDVPSPDLFQCKGLYYICEDLRWITTSFLSKKYQSFSKGLYGHMLLKRESIRKKIKEKNEKKT